MSFLQLVLSLDKTKDGFNSIMDRICQFDRYRNISLSLKNVMFVMFVIAQLVHSVEFSVETNRTVEIVRICRICILRRECWNGVDLSLEILEHCRIAWKGWKVYEWLRMSGMSLESTGVTGVPLEGLVAGMPGMSLEGLRKTLQMHF